MIWSRPWDQIDGWMRRAAVGEAMAHLRALEQRGILEPTTASPPTGASPTGPAS